MLRKIYNRISEAFLYCRYHRLYRRLFWHYVEKYDTADEAGVQAADAFFWLTGYEWQEWLFNFHPKCQQREGK